MDMVDVASYFDDTVVSDGVTGDFILKGQLDLYDDSQRDGVGTERRVLSYDPRLVFDWPAHKLITLSGATWVVGGSMPDDFLGSIIRKKAVIQRAAWSFSRQTAMGWLNADPEVPQLCGVVWTKDMKYEEATSEVRSFYTLWVGENDTARDGDFVKFQDRLHYVRNSYVGSTGMRAIEIVELPLDTIQTVAFKRNAQVYDPITDTSTDMPPVNVQALVMQYFDQYRIVSRAMIKPKPGDMQLRVRQADVVGITAGDVFSIGGFEFNVSVFLPEADGTYLVHLVR